MRWSVPVLGQHWAAQPLSPSCSPGLCTHTSKDSAGLPAHFKCPPRHPLLHVDTQARKGSPGVCSLEARTQPVRRGARLALQCGALRVRTSVAPGSSSSCGRGHAPLRQALPPHPCPHATMLSSSDHTCPRRPHDLQNPDAPQGIRVRPNLLKFAATMDPRVLLQISSLDACCSAALRPAALHEPRGSRPTPRAHTCQVCVAANSRGLATLRRCACPGHPVTAQVPTPALSPATA